MTDSLDIVRKGDKVIGIKTITSKFRKTTSWTELSRCSENVSFVKSWIHWCLIDKIQLSLMIGYICTTICLCVNLILIENKWYSGFNNECYLLPLGFFAHLKSRSYCCNLELRVLMSHNSTKRREFVMYFFNKFNVDIPILMIFLNSGFHIISLRKSYHL